MKDEARAPVEACEAGCTEAGAQYGRILRLSCDGRARIASDQTAFEIFRFNPQLGSHLGLVTARRPMAMVPRKCESPHSNHQYHTLHDLSHSGGVHMAVLIASIIGCPAVSADHLTGRHCILHEDVIHQCAQGTHKSSFASFPTVLPSGLAVW